LLGLWGLPQDLIEAVAFHHDPAAHEVHRFSPLAAVHAANALVHVIDEPEEEQSTPRKLDMRYLDRLRVTQRLSTWRELSAEMMAPA
jgi:HD-like signal output (HDOD) protein